MKGDLTMDARFVDLRSSKNPKARIKILEGHFATSNSHINTYIDMSTIKTRHNNARETAKVLADYYMMTTPVDSIVCLDETEVIGTFIAELLADSTNMSMSYRNNISVITPEFNQMGQMMFRDNKQRMIRNQQVLVLAASITTGTTMLRALETVLYYGGAVCGVGAIFSAVTKVANLEIKTIFTSSDLPNYHAYKVHDCPLCKDGKKVEAIVNSYGYSKLE